MLDAESERVLVGIVFAIMATCTLSAFVIWLLNR